MNCLIKKAGSVVIEVEELDQSGKLIRKLPLDKVGEADAEHVRHNYTPTDDGVFQVRFLIRPVDLKGQVYIDNLVVNQF